MKKFAALLLALALSASLSLTAFAEEPDAAAEAPANAPIRVWGAVSPWDGDGVYLVNDNEDDPFREVVVHLGDAPVADAATGLPLDLESIEEGDTLYAWIGPAATMSLPPQVFAIAVVGNVPEDAAVPEYYEVTGRAYDDPDNKDAVRVQTTSGTLALPKDVEITPWLTRQIVTLADLVPGTQILVWKNAEGTAEKVIVFAYGYQGYLTVLAASHGEILACVNGDFSDGETPQFPCRHAEDGTILVPVRAVAEAAGYDVRWDKTLGAVVSLGGETVLSVRPGAVTIQTSEGEADISAPCVLENGVTYLPAAELALWLNLYYTR